MHLCPILPCCPFVSKAQGQHLFNILTYVFDQKRCEPKHMHQLVGWRVSELVGWLAGWLVGWWDG